MDARAKILSELYANKHITSAIKKAGSGKSEQFQEDVRSDTFLALCEMPEDRLVGLHEANELIPYACFKILRQATDRRKIKPLFADNDIVDGAYLPDIIAGDQVSDINLGIDIASAMQQLNWFEKSVVDMYVHYGSISEIIRHTGSTAAYISRVLATARKKIKHGLD